MHRHRMVFCIVSHAYIWHARTVEHLVPIPCEQRDCPAWHLNNRKLYLVVKGIVKVVVDHIDNKS